MTKIIMVIEGVEYNLRERPEFLREIREVLNRMKGKISCDYCGASPFSCSLFSDDVDTIVKPICYPDRRVFQLILKGTCPNGHIITPDLILGFDYMNEYVINYTPVFLVAPGSESPVRDLVVIKCSNER